MSSPANGEKTNSGGVTWKHIVFLGLGRTTPAEEHPCCELSLLCLEQMYWQTFSDLLWDQPKGKSRRESGHPHAGEWTRVISYALSCCDLSDSFLRKIKLRSRRKRKKKQLLFTCIYLERECLQEDLISWVLPSMGIRVRWHLKIHTQKGAGSERREVVCLCRPGSSRGVNQKLRQGLGPEG